MLEDLLMKQTRVLSLSLAMLKVFFFFFFFANLVRYLELRVPLLRLSFSFLVVLQGLMPPSKDLRRLMNQSRLTQ